jgi:predicted dehydrogenase
VRRADVDAIAVCTPSATHAAIAMTGAEAGKHLLVEKPIDVTLASVDRLIAAARRANVVLACVFPLRTMAGAHQVKAALTAGRLGRLSLADVFVKWYRPQSYYDSSWRGSWALDGGGALMNQAVHSVDLLLWFMGPAMEVSAYTATLAHQRIEVEDVAVATIKFANGALGVIEASTATFPGELKRIEISGDAGSVVVREEDLAVWKFAKENKSDEAIRQKMASRTHTGGGAADPKAIGYHGHMLQFQDVLKAIKSGKRPLVDGPEGRKAIELILAIYKSAESGKPIKLPLAGDPPLKARAKGKKL